MTNNKKVIIIIKYQEVKKMQINKKMILVLLVLAVSFSGLVVINSTYAANLSAEEIMERVDENHYIDSARVESKLIIKDRGREIVKEMETYIESYNQTSNSLSEFLNPEDRGTRYLKLGDEIWMYFRDAEDLVSISGHMMRQGMMGSDFSYEDIMESEQLTDFYKFELKEENTINDIDVYVISATARESAEVSYYQRQIWVDQERFIVLREELYSTGGRLLKQMETEQVKEFDERWYPVEIIMNDKLREDSKTIYKINEIDFDYEIPEGKISLETLQ